MYFVPREFREKTLPLVETVDVGACSVCQSSEATPFSFGVDYEMSTCGNVWCFVRCRNCGHIYLNPRPAEGALSIIYPSSYYSYDFESKVNAIALWVKNLLDRRKLYRLFALMPVVGSYVDVGCGSGRFLRAARDFGVSPSRVHGLELDEGAAVRLRDSGFDVRSTRAEETHFPRESIDVVTMFHVIEHVSDPRVVLEKIFDWLRPDGVVAIETPNVDSLDFRLFRRSFWGGYHIPRHWHLFNKETLCRLANSCGFAEAGFWYTTGHSFWMYSFHHALRYNGFLPMPRLARFFDPLTSLFALSLVTGFDLVRGWLGFRTSSMLLVLRKPV